MFRFANNFDIEALTKIWINSFHDHKKTVEFFLNANLSEKSTLVCEIDGKVVSALYMLDCDVLVNGMRMPANYIYAAATVHNYRSSGIMSQLIEQVKNFRPNDCYSLLKPGSKSLFEYYSKRGYSPVFNNLEFHIKAKEIAASNATLFEVSQEYVQKLREETVCVNDFSVHFSGKRLNYAMQFSGIFGGFYGFEFNGTLGYAVVEDRFCKVIIKEMCCSPEAVMTGLSAIAKRFKANEYRLLLPADTRFVHASGKLIQNSMLMPYRSSPMPTEFDVPYVGLTLD